jgi:alkylation response protein AidB-like acyl-CoA dehydrogenase
MSELAAAFDQALEELLPFSGALERAGKDTSLEPGVREEILAMGWNGLLAPEEAGGLDLEIAEVIELCSVAGRHLLPVAFLDESLLLAPALGAVADPALHAVVEGRLAGGAGYVTDEAASVDGDGTVSVSEVGVRLSPGARLVALAHPEWTAVIPLDDPGVRLESADALDRGQGVHMLSTAALRPRAMLEGWMSGGEVAVGWLAGVLADLVGGSGRILELSLAHARVREQFGRPLIRFQAVTHLLAEMKARVELMRSAVARLSFLMAEGALDASFMAGLLWSVPAYAREVCESAIQVHGGIGFTWEYGLHLYYRRILSLQSMLGGDLDASAMAGRAYLASF